MTKTYHDIEAVTRLLEEKERDLELAAKIGQTLLEKNKHIEEKNEHLEELVTQANERIKQLKHDLSMKDELLKLYTENYEGAEGGGTPEEGLGQDGVHLPGLQRKVKTLEEENLYLHLETSKLKSFTDNLEEKEQKLVNDCVQQLEDVHQQLEQFAKELSEKTEECCTQKDEITNLLHQIVTLQKRVRLLTAENMDLQKTMEAAHDSQNYLSREIADLKEKNEELLALLEQSQEELRRFRNMDRPNAVRHNYMSSMLNCTGESLASELENSLRNEMDFPRGYSPSDRRRHNWKIFETAKAAKNAGNQSYNSSCSASMLGINHLEAEESFSKSPSQRSSMYFSDTESGLGEMSSCSEREEPKPEWQYGMGHKLGRPGIPGSNDLQTALRRLSMRRANELNEMDYARAERARQDSENRARERTVSEVSEQCETIDTGNTTPGRCHTPESMLSANSGYISMTGSSNFYKMPERLRIIKPLEGSLTLRQWQRLATPHLGGIFEARPGVHVKGEQKFDLEPEVYTLSDYEEDDDFADYPSRFQESCGVYTYTDSTVRHPTEAASLSSTSSSATPKMATCSQTSNSGTSTFSMSFGLASILNERDLTNTPPEDSQHRSTHRGSNDAISNPARFPSLVSDSRFEPMAASSPQVTLSSSTGAYHVVPSSQMTLTHDNSRSNECQGHYGSSRSSEGHDDPTRSLFVSQVSGNIAMATCSDISAMKPNGTTPKVPISSSSSRRNSDASTSTTMDRTPIRSYAHALGVINAMKHTGNAVKNTGFNMYEYFARNGTGSRANSTESMDTSRPDTLQLNTSVNTVMASGSRSTVMATAAYRSSSSTPVAHQVTMATHAPTSITTSSTGNVISAGQYREALATVKAGGAADSGSDKASYLVSRLSRVAAGSVLGALNRYKRDSP